jgi:hypothetical protein
MLGPYRPAASTSEGNVSSKPSDFLIGVGEFIGVLLPGSAVAYLLMPSLRDLAAKNELPPLHGTAAWLALAVISYMAGHLIFLIGSFLDRPYDWARQRWRPRKDDPAYQHATELAERVLGRRLAAMNTYKFATAILALNHDAAHTEVRQFEADSKFFRSLVVLGIGSVGVGIYEQNVWLAAGALLATMMCAWRSVERRWKATHRAFEYVVVIFGLQDKAQLGELRK